MLELQIKEYLKDLGTGGEPDPKLLEEFKEACGQAVTDAYKERGDWALRMSAVGQPFCKQWHKKQGTKASTTYNMHMRFLFGHLIEALLIYIMKSAGIQVEDEQKETNLNICGVNIPGHLDFNVGGKTWDAKSASPYAFSNKFAGEWGGYNKVKADDPFGYLAQGYGYAKAEAKPFGGWIVVDKSSGEVAVVKAPVYQEMESKAALEQAEENIQKLVDDAPFEKCYKCTDETYTRGTGKNKESFKSGNKLLPKECGFCEYKYSCWPKCVWERKVTGGDRARHIWYAELKNKELPR